MRRVLTLLAVTAACGMVFTVRAAHNLLDLIDRLEAEIGS